MLGIDLIGAGAGLSTQTIQVRVRDVNVAKLQQAIGTKPWGLVISPALGLVDQFPQQALDMLMPIARQQLGELGITADISATNSPPPPRPPAEAKKALVIGTIMGAVLAVFARWAYHRVNRKDSP